METSLPGLSSNAVQGHPSPRSRTPVTRRWGACLWTHRKHSCPGHARQAHFFPNCTGPRRGLWIPLVRPPLLAGEMRRLKRGAQHPREPAGSRGPPDPRLMALACITSLIFSHSPTCRKYFHIPSLRGITSKQKLKVKCLPASPRHTVLPGTALPANSPRTGHSSSGSVSRAGRKG